MKKIIFAFVALTTGMVSCTVTDESAENGGMENERLSFSTYVNMNTRALDKSVFVNGDVLGINACLSEGELDGNFTNNFMVNEALTKNDEGRWTYENAKFWPANTDNRVSFVASYPKIDPVISEGRCSFDFEVKSTAPTQEDFMWSTITDAHRSDRNGTYQNGVFEDPATTPVSDVVLHFRHALSRVVFSVKAAAYYGGATITVTDITLNNLYGAGTYTLSNTLSRGEWTMSGEQDHSYVALENGTNTAVYNEYRTVGTSLLLMPQVLSTEEGNASTVTIRYTVNYAAPERVVMEERTFSLATPSLLSGNTWEQDKVYNYQFNIALDMITFDAVVDGWGDSENTEFTVN